MTTDLDLTAVDGFGPKHTERMKSWFKLQPSTARACLMTTAGKQHRRWPCPGCDDLGHAGLLDHASTWQALDGRRVVVAEPYELTADDLTALRQRAGTLGLTIERLPISPWFPGQTHAWAVYAPGAPLVPVPEDGAVVQVIACEAIRGPGLPTRWEEPRPATVSLPAHMRPRFCPECDGPALPDGTDFTHDGTCDLATLDWSKYESDLA